MLSQAELKGATSGSTELPMDLEALQQYIRENKLTTIALGQVKVLDAKRDTKEIKSLSGHSKGVLALVTLPDNTLVSGSWDNTIKLWDAKSGACVKTLSGHSKKVCALAVLPDGMVASGSWDDMIKLWNLKSGACVKTFSAYDHGVFALAVFLDGTIASGSQDDTIKLWNIKNGACVKTLSGHNGDVYALAVLPDGTVASGSSDKTIKLWDTKKWFGNCLKTLSGHAWTVSALAVLPDGTLASGSGDATIKLWDIKSGACVKTLSGHSGPVNALAVLPDGTVVSGSRDKTIKLWDVKSGACVKTLSGHSDYVSSLAILSDGTVASGSGDNTIKLWDVNPRRALSLVEVFNVIALLKTNRSVTHLNLQETAIDDNAIPALIELCTVNTTLLFLDLQKTAITDSGLRKLYEAVKLRKPLLQLQHEGMVKIEAEEAEDKTKREAEAARIKAEEQERLQRELEAKIANDAKEARQKQFDLLQKKAAENDAASQFELAQQYEKGNEFISQNLTLAFEWYLRAAYQDHEIAQQRVGVCYHKGLGVKKDYAQAYLWYQKAADKGNDEACLGLKALTDIGYRLAPTAEFAKIPAITPQVQSSAPTIPSTPSSAATPAKESEKEEVKDSKIPAKTSALSLPTIPRIAWSELKVGALIGNGSYGDVYQGQWYGKSVAIKQLQLKTLPEKLAREFEHEADIMMQCHFPSIVRLYGVCTEAGHFAMVMEYLSEGSLRHRLADGKPLSWPDRIQMALDIAQGLAYLHARCILHRDLKSLNVLLGPHHKAKISDFGLAKVKQEIGSTTTKSHKTEGTVRWRAPELFKRNATHTPASDVYSLGMILWEIVTRQLPYADASDELTVISWIKDGEQEKIPDDCPKALADIIRSCWAAPEKRPKAEDIVVSLKMILVEVERQARERSASEEKGVVRELAMMHKKVDQVISGQQLMQDSQELLHARVGASTSLLDVSDAPASLPRSGVSESANPLALPGVSVAASGKHFLHPPVSTTPTSGKKNTPQQLPGSLAGGPA